MYDDDLIDEMNAYYDARARWHDAYMGFTSDENHELLMAPVTSVLEKVLNNKSILELGCGTGNWTNVLSKLGKEITAIDSSPSMIEIAKDKTASNDNVTLLVHDAYKLAELNIQTDVIFSSDFYSHIPVAKINDFLKGLVCLVSSKGQIIFLDMMFRRDLCTEEASIDNDGNLIQNRSLVDGRKFKIIKNFPDRFALEKVYNNFSGELEYYTFEKLKRWMSIFYVS